ncbi:predicted protein [Nematostella vectensis]|uniref:Hexosyltransferase n=2 Tax=Nematostella vectensis TaxID=45351 RepID=A7S396_NEMVE|nr:predicted protein [Nematostella vectensis]|eukprot:XP_001633876.1 predicted protein [Nematostella vectensis]
MDNIIEGVYRFDINHGVEYEIYFNDSKSKGSVLSARVFRKLSKPQIVLPSLKYKQPNELINLIVPLSGRIERFQQFIDLFIDVCIKRDKHVYLTVVLYGEKDFKIIRRILKDLEDSYNFRKYQLIMRNKQFSRGRALHDGVIYWKGKNPNVLMFFCDVDVTFDEHFLRRCRSYTEPSKQVYYPMVFSLYNPRNVYEDGMIPSPQEQLNIGNQYGYWRIYGYGMTCQYRSDYLRVGGFDLSIRGWGSEDHKLHRMYVAKPEIRIIRAPDRSLFHHYHEKHCDPSLKWEQYRSCLGSKAKTEGTLQQIALQLFKLRDKYNDDTGSDR